MAQTQIILVRHGQSQGNVAAELAQREHLERIDVPARDPDIELSDLGREQAQAVGRWLSRLGEMCGVVASSLHHRALPAHHYSVGLDSSCLRNIGKYLMQLSE